MTSDTPIEENEIPDNPQPGSGPELNIADLQSKTREELIAISAGLSIPSSSALLQSARAPF